MSGEQLALQRWFAYRDYVGNFFYRPDFLAIRVLMASICAHFTYPTSPPAWLFLVGASGSGKTAIGIETIEGMAKGHIYPAAQLSARAMLSGFGKSAKQRKGNSLLLRIGKQGVISFKDFTTYLSMSQDEKNAVAAMLREMYDGSVVRDTGNAGETLRWPAEPGSKGKITIIAAATSALENDWRTLASMGERFLTVRWPSLSRKEQRMASRYATQRQSGKEEEIRQKMHGLALELLGRVDGPKDQRPVFCEPLDLDKRWKDFPLLGESLAELRTPITRDFRGRIDRAVDIEKEQLTRASKGLDMVVRGHASLFRRPIATRHDVLAGLRVALDSIPPVRRAIFMTMPAGSWKEASMGLNEEDICERIKRPPQLVRYHAEELEHLGIIKILRRPDVAPSYELSRLGYELRHDVGQALTSILLGADEREYQNLLPAFIPTTSPD